MDKGGGPMLAGIYCRISYDKTGQRAGVDRQEADCRALCERRGWQVTNVYVDNDTSAYSRKPRPEWLRLLDDLKSGRVTAVVAWHPDRLYRQVRDLLTLLDLCRDQHFEVATVTAGDVDLSTATGRATATTLAAWNAHESEHKAERISRAHRQMAEQGRPVNGSRAFGYDKTGLIVVADEADLIRQAAARVLADPNHALNPIIQDWNAQGITTSVGKPWRSKGLRQVLMSARIAGLRSYYGAISKGQWPAIVSADDHARLVAVLGDPGRVKNNGGARRYLLTGLLYCGRCDQPMFGQAKMDGRGNYACKSRRGGGTLGCGQLARLSDPVEHEVVERWIAAIADSDFRSRLVVATPSADGVAALADLDRLTAELQNWEDDVAEGRITRAEYYRIRDKLTARIEAARQALSRATATRGLADLPSGEQALRAAWEPRAEESATALLARRRALLSLVIERVTLLPAVKGLQRFDPKLVRVSWKA
jgi:site-specific DNA recombinase